MQKTKIVCTIGPNSLSLKTILAMAKAGMSAARINLKHGNYDFASSAIQTVRRVSNRMQWPIAVMADLQGPEIRTGKIDGGSLELKKGQKVKVTTNPEGKKGEIPIPFKNLSKLLTPGKRILLADGSMELKVSGQEDSGLSCTVVRGGVLSDHKGVNIPGLKLSVDLPTEKDKEDLSFCVRQKVDFIALSFVRNAEDVRRIRKFVEDSIGDIPIISKIENGEAYKNIDEIIEISDGIMVARGDLGVETPLYGVPVIQKDIIRKCNRAGKMVITATQMLDSMINNPRPTRAEVSDVVNAILDGTDAMLLSGETAVGKFPAEVVKTMAEIAQEAEGILEPRVKNNQGAVSTEDTVSFSVCKMASDIGAKAIVCCTYSGRTARNISKYRPNVPTYAATSSNDVMRKLALVWGVYPLRIRPYENTDELIKFSLEEVSKKVKLKKGDEVVITAGVPVGIAGRTNMILVRKII